MIISRRDRITPTKMSSLRGTNTGFVLLIQSVACESDFENGPRDAEYTEFCGTEFISPDRATGYPLVPITEGLGTIYASTGGVSNIASEYLKYVYLRVSLI